MTLACKTNINFIRSALNAHMLQIKPHSDEMPSKAQRLKMGLEKLQEYTLKVSGPEPEAHNWFHYQPQSL